MQRCKRGGCCLSSKYIPIIRVCSKTGSQIFCDVTVGTYFALAGCSSQTLIMQSRPPVGPRKTQGKHSNIYIQRLCYSWRRFPQPACHAFLFSQSPGRRFLLSISRCMFSLHSRLGLPVFLLLFGTQSNILLGHRSSVIFWTCPYHMSLFMLIVSIMSLFLCTLLLISSFRTCSSPDMPHALLQIFTQLNCFFCLALSCAIGGIVEGTVCESIQHIL